MVDWSAATVPRTGRDSIWICWHARDSERLENPPTRRIAKSILGDWLAAALERGERVLLGFDFPFGYPVGFAARLGLSGPPWRAVWDEIARLIEDTEGNGNNRFRVAAELNQRVSNGCFPFWGRPPGFDTPLLGSKHHRRHEGSGLAERRLVDLYIPSAQPCWKLLGSGSVGGQALTGIPMVRALRDDPRWIDRARVWPFETGLQVPDQGSVVFAEVYPSLWAVSPADGEPKDAAQVRSVARFFAESDRAGKLAALFAGDPTLTPEQRHRVETEEAWTLGVTAARQRPIPVPAMAPRAGALPASSPTFPRKRGREGWGSNGEQERAQHCIPVVPGYTYLKDPAEISRRSFALIRAEADLTRFPQALKPLALRLAHAAGDSTILGDLGWSKGAVAAGRRALAAGAPILVDAGMVAAGIKLDPSRIICKLHDPETARQAAAERTTRSAAAAERWRPYLPGAVVAIGNAPTALFRLLELLAQGAPQPALILGFPVGFVGAAEAKAALADFGQGLEFITLHGRRGGSALAAAAVNALALPQ
ncbi:MAG: precorrin-8X methylmutase [Alphaproteobacteria bacterium]|nr:precorrin-8X methylmutase [Alphaproteobacteria bacterium]MBV9377196.1 precorrin-8X methylmutase [Alphaproteobacteria bacterium]